MQDCSEPLKMPCCIVVVLWVMLQLITLSETASFDYVIVGAGTSGLLLANRLSQIPNTSVAIIDPGADQRFNAQVEDPIAWRQLLHSSMDWAYQTVPQGCVLNRTLACHAGKGIGGTSLINGMTYIRGDRAQLDAWEELGNVGWNWETFLRLYKKTEKLVPPADWQRQVGASADGKFHGTNGDLFVGFSPKLQNGTFFHDCENTWRRLGQTYIEDVGGGSTKGFDVWPQTIDPNRNIRWDSATGFLWPILGSRRNLHLINGTVRRILWEADCDAEHLEAAAVEYISPFAETHKVVVEKEVVLSAGALRTPLVLELSGVGSPQVLKGSGIQPVVDLPGVGENLIDQTNVPLMLSSKVAHNDVSPYATFLNAVDIFGARVHEVAAEARRKLRAWAEQAARSRPCGPSVTALEHRFHVQHSLMFDENVTIAEILTTGLGDQLVSSFWNVLPFSRGSIHLSSVNDYRQPVIDPNYLSVQLDMAIQVAAGRLAARFWRTKPIMDSVSDEFMPGNAELPENATDAQWQHFIRESLGANAHFIGTASMMARQLGGVVDAQMKVYGTRNVRVVDASVVPMQLSGHLTATLYAIAERAAEAMQRE